VEPRLDEVLDRVRDASKLVAYQLKAIR